MKTNFLINGYSKPVSMLLTSLETNHIKNLFWINHHKREKIILKDFNNVSCINNYDLCKAKFNLNIRYNLKIPSELIKIINLKSLSSRHDIKI